ncbi:MAG: hypothetical protein ACRED7_08020 [Stellaceae bacterium]
MAAQLRRVALPQAKNASNDGVLHDFAAGANHAKKRRFELK